MGYTNNHVLFAKMLGEAYKNVNKRKEKFKFNKMVLTYVKEKSNEIYCHYENEGLIIVCAHGAVALEQQLSAIGQFFSPSTNDKVMKSICDKYKELLDEPFKYVVVVGHSLGTYGLARCMIETGKTLPAFFFANYAPHPIGEVVEKMRNDPKIQNIFFKNDIFARNLLLGKIKNKSLVFKPHKYIHTWNSHALFNFQKMITGKSSNVFEKLVTKNF